MRDWRGVIPTSEDLGPLRDHQERLFKRANDLVSRVITEKITVLQATPGAGKTLAASVFAHVLIRSGFVDRVVIVVPRESLRDQMVEGFTVPERALDLRVMGAASDVSAKVIFDKAGYVTTYQAVARRAGARHLKAVANCRTLLILDEIHHLVDEEGKGWVPGVRALVDHAVHVLAMSGNLGRHDDKPIPFIEYGEDRAPIKQVVYSRAKALDEGAIIPLRVEIQDGDTEFFHKGKTHEVTLSTASARKEKRALRTALNIQEYVDRIVTNGLAAWLEYRELYYRSQLIVVCDKQDDARNVAHQIRVAHPHFEIALAISDEGVVARRALKRFRTRTGADILVTCMMAYEGLDAPWATHMIYLSNKRSLPWLEQATARITRFNGACGVPRERQSAVVFAPGDASMRAFVAQLNAEQDDRYREQAEKHTAPGIARRSDFQPINAVPTVLEIGGEGGLPSSAEQSQMRELVGLYPHLKHMPQKELLDLARRLISTNSAAE